MGILLFVLTTLSCEEAKEVADNYYWDSMEVTATAYNSFSSQTMGDPNITAWGDTLKPGIKVIAVSRDLLDMGLGHNTMVRIEGFPDTFYVKDKMHRRWRKRIDIFMDADRRKAKEWGRKKICIEYAIKKEKKPLRTD